MVRLELTLSFVFLFVMILWGLRLGWKSRLRRQGDIGELPVLPARLGADLAPPVIGMYLGTTVAMHWQDRIVAHTLGQRANTKVRLTHQGVVIERAGADTVFIPDSALIDARLEAAIAGRVVGKGGVLVFRWRQGEHELDTGVRGDDRAVYLPWIRAIETRTPRVDISKPSVTETPTSQTAVSKTQSAQGVSDTGQEGGR